MEEKVFYKGVEITKEAILKALSEFDTIYKDTNDYNDWLNSKNYKYALLYNGKKYPHKYILSKVSGVHTDMMLGGLPIAEIFTKLGFAVQEKGKDSKIKYFRCVANEPVWSRCISDNNYATGDKDYVEINKNNAWFLLDDLSKIKDNLEAIKYKITKTFPKTLPSQIDSKAKGVYDFLHINIGDYLIATKGKKEIYGYGIVTGPYRYRTDYENCRHTIPVNWINTDNKLIPDSFKDLIGNWTGRAFIEISEDLFNKLINIGEKIVPTKSINSEVTELILKKKQIILYGPPGTGKTYNTKRIAVQLMEEGK